MKDTMGGLVLLQLFYNQWEIMITVEKNINASSVYTTTLSSYCKDVHFKSSICTHYFEAMVYDIVLSLPPTAKQM